LAGFGLRPQVINKNMAEPRCPYYGKCGGCDAQHVDYAVQLENKRKALIDALKCKEFPEDRVLAFSDTEYGYRNRMDMAFWNNWFLSAGRELPAGDNGKDRLGFRVKGKWFDVVDVSRCAISNSRLNELLAEVRAFFVDTDEDFDAYDLNKKKGTFRYSVIRTPAGDSSICFVLNADSTRLDEAVERVKKFAFGGENGSGSSSGGAWKGCSANNVSVAYVSSSTDMSVSEEFFVIKGSDMLVADLMGKKFEFSVQGFFQNNSAMAEKMHKYVHEILEKSNRGQYAFLLDLYGGVGTFGINNADLFHKVLTVEAFAPSIDSAKKNIARNNVVNADAMVLDAQYLKRLDLPSKDLYVVTDPPRSGMHPKTIEHLRKAKPKVIIYISCNVAQLKSDLPKFTDYKVKSAAVFDLFPQTRHMESVVEME